MSETERNAFRIVNKFEKKKGEMDAKKQNASPCTAPIGFKYTEAAAVPAPHGNPEGKYSLQPRKKESFRQGFMY